jgi:hypothetical protein
MDNKRVDLTETGGNPPIGTASALASSMAVKSALLTDLVALSVEAEGTAGLCRCTEVGAEVEVELALPIDAEQRAFAATGLRRPTAADPPRHGLAEVTSGDFDEDALARALLGGFDDYFFLPSRDSGHAFGASRVIEDLVALLDVSETVVQQDEHVGGDLLAEPISGAKVLVDPYLHAIILSSNRIMGTKGSTKCVTKCVRAS